MPTLRATALAIAIAALCTASAVGAEITCGPYSIGRCVETGTAAADVITGSRFNDTQRGLGGNDRLRGGLGNDTIDARDGRRDDVNCGAGRHDRARVDKVDRVRGCEVVTSA